MIRSPSWWARPVIAIILGTVLALALPSQVLRASQQLLTSCVATGVQVATPTGYAAPNGIGTYTFHGECDVSWDGTAGDVTQCAVRYIAETFQWPLLSGWSPRSSVGPYPSLAVACDSSTTMSLDVGTSGLFPNTWYRMRVSAKSWNPAIATDGQPVGCSGAFVTYNEKDFKTGPVY